MNIFSENGRILVDLPIQKVQLKRTYLINLGSVSHLLFAFLNRSQFTLSSYNVIPVSIYYSLQLVLDGQRKL